MVGTYAAKIEVGEQDAHAAAPDDELSRGSDYEFHRAADYEIKNSRSSGL